MFAQSTRLGSKGRVLGHSLRHASSVSDHQVNITNRMARMAREQPPSAKYVLRKVQPPTLAPYLHIEPKVLRSLTEGAPVVALESTIISHGMPYPQNIETALELEKIVAEQGATPATIALMDGKIHIGLEPAALEKLALAGPTARKCSRRDISNILATQEIGATTVSATMIAANMVKIPLFVTGGIGGVHRGVADTWDISADLTELQNTPVAVVCSGVKSILDIPKTLEFLETAGVPVISYKSDYFPAFFSVSSGMRSPIRMDSTSAIAKQLFMHQEIGFRQGTVIAAPNPEPAAGEAIEAGIQQALRECEEQNIRGRDITPYMLKRLNEITRGASLQSNIALVKNNAVVGGRIAIQLAQLKQKAKQTPGTAFVSSNSSASGSISTSKTKTVGSKRQFSTTAADATPVRMRNGLWKDGTPVVVGGAVMDILSKATSGKSFLPGTSNIGVTTVTAGGVGRNIAQLLGQLHTREQALVAPISATDAVTGSEHTQGGASASHHWIPRRPSVHLVTAVADDAMGMQIREECSANGVQVWNVHANTTTASTTPLTRPFRTPTYTALLDSAGELVGAVADMSAFEAISPQTLSQPLEPGQQANAEANTTMKDLLASASFVLIDGNMSLDTVSYVTHLAAQPTASPAGPVPVIAEPISVEKGMRFLHSDAMYLTTAIKPNVFEASMMANHWRTKMGLPPLPPIENADLLRMHAAFQGKELELEAVLARRALKEEKQKETEVGVADVVEFEDPANPSENEGGNGVKDGAAVSGEGLQEEEDEDAPVDYHTLVAAQTLLAMMLREGGDAIPISKKAMEVAWEGLDSTAGEEILQKEIPLFARGDAGGASSPSNSSNPMQSTSTAKPFDASHFPADFRKGQYPGGLIDGRKHVLVSLGKGGVLWLSCTPVKSREVADLCAALPFFTACRHSEINFDFKLIPAPHVEHVKKVTGAGDSFLGTLLWALTSPNASNLLSAAESSPLNAFAGGIPIAQSGDENLPFVDELPELQTILHHLNQPTSNNSEDGATSLPGRSPAVGETLGCSMGTALRLGLAGAKTSLETDPSVPGAGGAVSTSVDPWKIVVETVTHVPPVDDEYC